MTEAQQVGSHLRYACGGAIAVATATEITAALPPIMKSNLVF
jgi:hypothetical protein